MKLILDLLVAAHLVQDPQGDHGRRSRRGRQAVADEDGAAGDGLGAHFRFVHGVGDGVLASVLGGLLGEDVGDVDGDGFGVEGVVGVLLFLGCRSRSFSFGC